MQHTLHIETNTAFLNLMFAFDQFDGVIDPAFDSEMDELERQFQELRFTSATELN